MGSMRKSSSIESRTSSLSLQVNSIDMESDESLSLQVARKIIILDIILSEVQLISKILPFVISNLPWLSNSNSHVSQISIASQCSRIIVMFMFTKPKGKMLLAIFDSLFVQLFDLLVFATRFLQANISSRKPTD